MSYLGGFAVYEPIRFRFYGLTARELNKTSGEQP
jgi:hypothetical protein